MAEAQTQATPRAKRAVSRRGTTAATRRRRRPVRRARAADVGQLEQLIRDLEAKIANLTSDASIRATVNGATSHLGKAVNTASSHVGDLAADMLTDVAGRLRGGANSVTGVARMGTGAIQKIGLELERRPMMTVAIALGIGFLAGLTGRRSDDG